MDWELLCDVFWKDVANTRKYVFPEGLRKAVSVIIWHGMQTARGAKSRSSWEASDSSFPATETSSNTCLPQVGQANIPGCSICLVAANLGPQYVYNLIFLKKLVKTNLVRGQLLLSLHRQGKKNTWGREGSSCWCWAGGEASPILYTCQYAALDFYSNSLLNSLFCPVLVLWYFW